MTLRSNTALFNEQTRVQVNRLDAGHGRFINRSKPVQFFFENRSYWGYEGDTVASALAANGQFVLSRSFKYHRARGAMTMAGQDAHTLVQVPGNPNALADCVPISDGLRVQPVNVFGKLMRDRAAVLGRFSRFLPVGFYYKAFYRPKGAWEYWAKLFRPMTGLGTLDTDFKGARHDKRYRFFDVVVVGGGPAGMAAALEAARGPKTVLLVDENSVLGGSCNYLGYHERAYELDLCSAMVDELEQSENVTIMTNAVCNGWFADNWVPVVQGNTLHKVRATDVVLATGVLEQPSIFRNNDLPGVMMSSAALRLINQYGVQPGKKAVVLTSNEQGYETAIALLEAGVEVAAVVELRETVPSGERIKDFEGRGIPIKVGRTIYSASGNASNTHVCGVELASFDGTDSVTPTGEYIEVDLVCMAVGFMPTYQLACQAGAQLNYDDRTSAFSIKGLPSGLHIAGAVNGVFQTGNVIRDGRRAVKNALRGGLITDQSDVIDEGQSPNAPWPIVVHPKGKEFVDTDEDLQISDLINATKDGYIDIQLVKRYSTCGMGPSQGRQSALAAARIIANATQKSVAETGVTTARPPFGAETLAQSAGRSFYPRRLTSMDSCHRKAGATMMLAGAWERPAFYGNKTDLEQAVRREVHAVRNGVGLIDVSTLGGLEIRGPDAGELINRLYTWGFVKQPVGRARYALMTDEAGVVIDDGVACRFSDTHYYVTATTSGVDRVYRAMLKWNAQWRLDVDIANVTGAWSAVNLAGPQARSVLSRACNDVDLKPESFGYMEIRQGTVAGIPSRMLRVGFVGELGFEIHVPQQYGRALWESLMSAGADASIVPFGVEAQRVMRLEKGHIIIGQDTDAMSNPLEVQMQWAVSNKKPFFVGGRSLLELEKRGIKRKLVGFRLDPGVTTVPLENQLVLEGDAMIGRVTSSVLSPTLGHVIGLAYVPYNYADATFCIKCSDKRVTAEIVPTPFYDPENKRQLL